MAKQYKWRTTFAYQNQHDPNYHLSYGVTPATYDQWQTADVDVAGSNSATYYYRDANMIYTNPNPPPGMNPEGWWDDVSSQVNYSITQTWTTTIDSRNNLTVSISTVINSIDRVDARGGDQNTPGRTITVYKQQGGVAYVSTTDTQVATNHNISGSVDLGTYTFTLAPGQDAKMSTLYIHNQTVGSSSYDDIWAGVQFMNPLPADYRPGTTFKSDNPYMPGNQNGLWMSHNRTNKAAHVLADVENITWQEMRTINGDSGGQGNPPLILHQADANSWYNQKLLGKD